MRSKGWISRKFAPEQPSNGALASEWQNCGCNVVGVMGVVMSKQRIWVDPEAGAVFRVAALASA